MGIEQKVEPALQQTGAVEFMLPRGEPLKFEHYNLGLDSKDPPRRVALLANGFPEADVFLEALAKVLREAWPETEFVPAVKASANQLNIGIREPLLSDLAESCDAVIIAWGHCGSCTSGVTRDAIAFYEKGVPSVTLICDIFWEYSAWLGPAMGLEAIPRVQIPFPLAGTSAENQADWARRVAPEIRQKLALAA